MRRFRFAQTLTAEAGGGELELWAATTLRQRLTGLAGLRSTPARRGLLIPACASVHTWGMRFPIDIAFLEWPPRPGCAVLRLCEAVGPGRLRRLARPARRTAVLEAPAGTLAVLRGAPGTVSAAVTFRPCSNRT